MELTSVIEAVVKRMRAKGQPVAASMVSAWRSFIVVLGTILVVLVFINEPSPYIFGAKVSMVVVAVAAWLSDAYFIRKNWDLTE